ncbi:DNA repair protein RecO [Spiroplasma cantharicola]|uniref:DNA repair protein RecO n=1 Tax=Spiroplasma cantharicola TaxID=362837 RepID=A0A0M4JX46_9MOLU|nr:DNA repair protein RecO [Spiroplasma cantharicola]ALD66630.1 DNA repair protein recO [Spiroplasma cantharicola]
MGATKINAVVIESNDFDDYAKIVKVFSKQFGKLSFMAPGVNKSTSKNKYSIQTFSWSDFEIFKSRREDRVSKLKTGVLKKEYFNIAKNYNNYVYGSIMFKILDQIEQISNKNYKIFKMLTFTLENISNNKNPFINYLFFITHLIQETIQPFRLNGCIRCKKTTFPIVRFEYSENGFVCARCLWPGEIVQPDSFIRVLVNIHKKTIHFNVEQKYEYTDLIVIHNIVVNYYENNLGFYLGPIYLLKDTVALNVNEKVAEHYK